MRRSSASFAFAVLVLLVTAHTLSGCGTPRPLALTKPDIVGKITDASSTLTSRIPAGDRTVLIEGKIEKGASVDRASVKVTDGTTVYQQSGDLVRKADASLLAVGENVQATFSGPVLESYPVQATAAEIVIISGGAIEAVKDAYTAKLMSTDGVVGVGIGESNGHKVIKVFLESDSPRLRAKVPEVLGGYQVVTEVTGPVRPQ